MADKQTKYEALVHALHGDIYRYAYWLCRDPQIAEDLVQETFLRAWKAIDTLLDDKAAKAWLITILRRENARRFERKQFDLVDLDEHPYGIRGVLPSEQEMEHEWLRRHIARLPAEYQEPLLLQVLGIQREEIAEQLGLNKNTVMTRLFRARNQIKEAMESAKQQRDTPMDELEFRRRAITHPRTGIPPSESRRGVTGQSQASGRDAAARAPGAQHSGSGRTSRSCGADPAQAGDGSRRGAGGPAARHPASHAMARSGHRGLGRLPARHEHPLISWPVAPDTCRWLRSPCPTFMGKSLHSCGG